MENPLPQRPYRRADHGAHVLVVEDVAVTREFLRRLLVDNGYRVSDAATGAEAIATLDEGLPDLVLLDLLLPDFHGLEVCRHLRSLEGGEDVPVLVITMDERPESHAEAVQAGVDDFLRKPLLPTELRTRVRSLIRLRHLRTELRRDTEAILTLQARKDELLQFVVHDLKNMLGTLLASVDLLGEGASPTEKRQRCRIEGTAKSMLGMVQNMLDLSIHEQAGLVPQPERISFATWIEQIRPELECITLRRNQFLELNVHPDLEVEADPQLFERVLFNLLENASKFGPKESTVRFQAEPLGSLVRFQVTDEGEGIPADMKDRIFDRFIRVDAHSSAHAGRGLGLAFCHLVTNLHGGRIWVEDHVPKGSRFLIELPLRFWELED
ncbi:MAG: hybrid sensor histidine kinase/response regulator [Holophaga sp.]|nr:hybrid sensor histidine kinase/response regulator [Holophaga sp.]